MVIESAYFDSPNILGVYKTEESAKAMAELAEKQFDKACEQAYDQIVKDDWQFGDLYPNFEIYLGERKQEYTIEIQEMKVED